MELRWVRSVPFISVPMSWSAPYMSWSATYRWVDQPRADEFVSPVQISWSTKFRWVYQLCTDELISSVQLSWSAACKWVDQLSTDVLISTVQMSWVLYLNQAAILLSSSETTSSMGFRLAAKSDRIREGNRAGRLCTYYLKEIACYLRRLISCTFSHIHSLTQIRPHLSSLKLPSADTHTEP